MRDWLPLSGVDVDDSSSTSRVVAAEANDRQARFRDNGVVNAYPQGMNAHKIDAPTKLGDAFMVAELNPLTSS